MTDSRPRVDAAALSTLTMRQCTGLLKPLMKMEDAALFLVPVDAVALKLDDYHTIVTEPMDLGTIEKKLDKSGYSSVEDFIRDVRLVWGNALKYNPPENPVYALADRMDAEFEKKLAELSGVPLTTAPAAGAAPAAAAKGPAVPFKDVKALLKILDNHKLSAPFRTPVDWEKGGLTNYLQVVERPMDLGTIGAKLDGAEPYATTAELLADVDLVWANCIKYNGEGAWISEHAQQLREHTAKKVKQLGWKEGATITPEPAKKPPAEKKAPPPPKPKAAPAPKPAAAPKAAAAPPPAKPKAPAGPSPGEAPRMGEAELAACQVAQTRSPTWEKVEAAATALGLTGVKFWRVRGDYYDQELAWRRDVLGAATTAQLCKAMIMENTKLVDLTAEAAAAQGRVKYACVVLQYDGPKLNKEKMTDLVRSMEGKAAVGKKQYNMRMVSEEANLTLSGFEHNAVTPVGMAQRMPIIVSAPLAAFEEMWLGAGEVDLKLKVNVQQFVAAYKKAEGCGAAFGDVVG